MHFSGRHKTVVGGREGLKIISRILKHEKVKRVIFGQIEAKGSRSGHGLRFKITRIDLKGNIRAVLSHGSSNQEILIVTKASSREEGERIAKEIMELLV
ncbi:MAG: hypothetical protein HA490_07270 [Archaeoglobales archaeon]|nr:hypothetical protein [Archaeoglobales archaeon]